MTDVKPRAENAPVPSGPASRRHETGSRAIRLGEYITPEALASDTGWSVRRVRKVARDLGACRVMGNRMVLLPCDVVLILKAAKPNLTVEDVKQWLAADALELLEEKIAQEWADPTGCVYFVQQDQTVKIGFTADLKGRLAKLKTSMAIEPAVLLTIPGTLALEAYFHNKFSGDRMAREWFRLSESINEFVARRQWQGAGK